MQVWSFWCQEDKEANPSTLLYWPGIGREIQDYCKSCRQCVAFNSHKRDVQPQQPIPVVTKPWCKLAMDIVGPLTTTASGHKYNLTVIDLVDTVAVPLKELVDKEVDDLLVV